MYVGASASKSILKLAWPHTQKGRMCLQGGINKLGSYFFNLDQQSAIESYSCVKYMWKDVKRKGKRGWLNIIIIDIFN